MIFFFKKKPIVLECYARDERVADVAPIRKSHHFIPDWWKQIPKSEIPLGGMYPYPTMKHCVGFINWYTNGVTVPMWCDLALAIGSKTNPGYQYSYADLKSSASHHGPVQHNSHYAEDKFQHIKLAVPWLISCNEPIKFMFVEHTWNMIHFSPIRIMPGVMEFKYQPSVNINLLIPRTEVIQNFTIPLLEPLVQMVPISDRDVKVNIHSDPNEFNKLNAKFGVSKFIKEYLTVSKIKKQNERK